MQPALVYRPGSTSSRTSGLSTRTPFVGTKPSAGAVSTKVPVDLIPVKLTCGSQVNDPDVLGNNGNNAVQQTAASPMLQKSVTYTEGAATVKTQYEDAFQKVSLWNKGASASGYHVLFDTPTLKSEVSLDRPVRLLFHLLATTASRVIEADINCFDPQIQSVITSDGVPGTTLPIFVTANSFLYDSSGCCIGGYHGYNGTKPIRLYNYLTTPGGFSQDVSALSHELGEWMDDPFTNNSPPPRHLCHQCATPARLYEVGDPLEGNANFGDLPLHRRRLHLAPAGPGDPGVLRCPDNDIGQPRGDLPGRILRGVRERRLIHGPGSVRGSADRRTPSDRLPSRDREER